MQIKGIYAGKPALFQLMVLLLFILAGSIISSFISLGLFYAFYGASVNLNESPNMMRIVQFLSAIGTFLFPAVGIAYTCSHNPSEYLSIRKIPKGNILLLTFVCVFLLSPTISLTGLLNKQMVLPDFLAPVEQWMIEQEALAEKLTLTLISDNRLPIVLFNLLVIAVTAGITEEFLFRGALQRIIEGWTKNHHIVIWSAAFLFSAFHLQFFGFLPRMLLGAYFGYLLYWSRNIWIPVFAHFVNNAFAVIGMSDEKLRSNEFVTGDISSQHLLPYSIAAVITLILLYFCTKKIKEELASPAKPTKQLTVDS